MKFSICIPTRNRAFLAFDLIKSILNARKDHYDVEIIIADNSEVPAYQLMVLEERNKNITYLHEPKPLAPWANWQRAARAATGDWVIMMPDKCIVDEDIFGVLDSFILNGANIKVITWKVLYGENFKEESLNKIEFIPPDKSISNLLLFDFYANDKFPHGMNCAYKRFEGHEDMYKPFCADYNQGMDLVVKYSLSVVHIDVHLTRISRNLTIEYSAGASISAGAKNEAANHYFNFVPSHILSDIEEISPIKDNTFPSNYIYYDLCMALFKNPFPSFTFNSNNYYAAYYRHLLEQAINYKKFKMPPVFNFKAFCIFIRRLVRDLRNRG